MNTSLSCMLHASLSRRKVLPAASPLSVSCLSVLLPQGVVHIFLILLFLLAVRWGGVGGLHLILQGEEEYIWLGAEQNPPGTPVSWLRGATKQEIKRGKRKWGYSLEMYGKH